MKCAAEEYGVHVGRPLATVLSSVSRAFEGNCGHPKIDLPTTIKWCGIVGTGGVSLRVCHGDIVNLPTDIIVNAANAELEHSGGVALAISVKAGSELNFEGFEIVKELPYKQIEAGSSMLTKAYNIPFVKFIVHAVGPVCTDGAHYECNLYRKTIRSALEMAYINGASSISIPLLGGKNFKWKLKVAAELLILAIAEWVGPRGITLMDITLIDSNEDAVNEMESAVQNFVKNGPPLASNAIRPVLVNCRPKNRWFWYKHEGPRHTDPSPEGWIPLDYDQVIQIEDELDKNLPLFCVTFTGDTFGIRSDSIHIPANETSAKYFLERKSNRSRNLNDPTNYEYVQVNIISKFERSVKYEPFLSGDTMSGYSESSIVNTPSVVDEDTVIALITESTESVRAAQTARHSPINFNIINPILEVFGLPNDVTDALQYVTEELRNAIETRQPEMRELFNELQIERPQILKDLEATFISADLDVNISIDDDNSKVNIRTLGARAMKAAEEIINTYVKAANRFEWPPEWPQDEYDANSPGYSAVAVEKDTEEWRKVELLWRNPSESPTPTGWDQNPTIPQGYKPRFMNTLVSIQRIQNPAAWANYSRRVNLLSINNKQAPAGQTRFVRANEYWMKHGTRLTDPLAIAYSELGLDFRYCDGDFYGKGAYCAEDATYCDRYRHLLPKIEGKIQEAQMFLVRVAAGPICNIAQRTDEHKKLMNPPDGYKSVRGIVDKDHVAIIVYRYESAYPAYLITYEIAEK